MNKNRELSHLSLSKRHNNVSQLKFPLSLSLSLSPTLSSSSRFKRKFSSNFTHLFNLSSKTKTNDPDKKLCSTSTSFFSQVSHPAHLNPVQSAFTIIELLVVIAIIAILAALIFVAYPAIVKSALQATMQSSLSTSYRAITSFQSMNDRLPTSISDCDSSTSTTAKDAGYSSTAATTLCLKPGNNFTYIYTYDNNSTPQTFTLYAKSTASSNQNLAYKVSSSNSNPIASTNGKTCPNNFILVPGSSTYGTSDFCVMKYEAKIYGNDNGTAGYSTTNLPNSRPGGTPYVNISQTNLIASGNNMATQTVDGQKNTLNPSAHLITEAEWMTIAQNVLQQGQNWSSGTVGTGFIYNGHVSGNPGSGLSADTNDSDSNYGETTYTNSNVNTNNKRTLTLSNGEVIWDLSGNVAEWTNGRTTGNQPGISGGGYGWREWKNITTNGSLSVNPFPSGTSISGVSNWASTNGIGEIDSSADDTNLRGFYRGGDWTYGNYAGVLALNFVNAPDGYNAFIGFRVTTSPQ